jgi:hypothetical protein
MKKLNVIFFSLAMVGCVGVFGKPVFSESKVAVVKTGKVFKVIYEGPKEAKVKITILNSDDLPIFSEKIISHGSFARPYNFSQLPEGDYKICVDDQNGKHVEKLCNTESREARAGLEVNYYEPLAHVVKLQNTENKYLVCIPKQREAEMDVRIYNKDQDLVFSEMKNAEDSFAKVYVLQNLEGASIGVANRSSGEEKLFKFK